MKVYHQSTFDKWPFEDNSIQSIITSPPYYSLRKYDIPDIIIGGGDTECEHEWGEVISERTDETGFQRNRKGLNKAAAICDGNERFATTDIPVIKRESQCCLHCNAWRGQYGLEPTYQLYIDHTLLWAKEAWRVLRDDGIFFLNIGDSYYGGKGKSSMAWSIENTDRDTMQKSYTNLGGKGETRPLDAPQDVPPKCKLLIPHRVAIGLIEQNWILRNDLIWYKPNSMPESVRDRFSKKFEYIFLLSKTGKYEFYLDAVREEHIWIDERGERIGGKSVGPVKKSKEWDKTMGGGGTSFLGHSGNFKSDGSPINNPLGKNPGDIWTINTQPSPEKHYAMWPESLVERMLLCSTKPGDAILDPFAGSGCTLRVADRLNREAYGIDLGYKDIQERRLTNIQKELIL